jgi:hypothetical protein
MFAQETGSGVGVYHLFEEKQLTLG